MKQVILDMQDRTNLKIKKDTKADKDTQPSDNVGTEDGQSEDKDVDETKSKPHSVG